MAVSQYFLPRYRNLLLDKRGSTILLGQHVSQDNAVFEP